MEQAAMIEQRLAEPAAEIRRNGKVYLPGGDDLVPVDQAAHAELLAVNGIAPTPWEGLPVAPTTNTLPAVIKPAKGQPSS